VRATAWRFVAPLRDVPNSNAKMNETHLPMDAGRSMNKGSPDRQQFKLSTANSIAMCTVGIVVGVILYLAGLAQKWDAPTVGTIVPFWYVTSVFRRRWASPSFWTVLSLCFVVHLGVVWAIFNVVLRSVDTRALALEYGSRGVRVNAVAPSFTSTEATADLEKSPAVIAAFRDRLPIGRAATPDGRFQGQTVEMRRLP